MKLIVKPIARGAVSGVVLHDAMTGLVLPNQSGGSLDYDAREAATLSVTFFIDGDDIRMWTGQPVAEIAEEIGAANDLQAAARAYAALSAANRARFLVMHDLGPRRAALAGAAPQGVASFSEMMAKARQSIGENLDAIAGHRKAGDGL